MSSKVFISGTVIDHSWLNDVNNLVYAALGSAGVSPITAAQVVANLGFPAAATIASVSNPLSQFAATTSAQLSGVISDETGTGALVFANSPTLIAPALGTIASGVATNLTGTATALNIGGNAATSTTTTNAINLTGSGTISAGTTGGAGLTIGNTTNATNIVGSGAISATTTGGAALSVATAVNATAITSIANFAYYFQSVDITITLNTQPAVLHGLGGKPLLLTAVLKNTTGELGYTAGDEITLTSDNDGSATTTVIADNTNITISIGSGITINNKGSNARAAITHNYWVFVVRAWK